MLVVGYCELRPDGSACESPLSVVDRRLQEEVVCCIDRYRPMPTPRRCDARLTTNSDVLSSTCKEVTVSK